jgi:hypothetical protein
MAIESSDITDKHIIENTKVESVTGKGFRFVYALPHDDKTVVSDYAPQVLDLQKGMMAWTAACRDAHVANVEDKQLRTKRAAIERMAEERAAAANTAAVYAPERAIDTPAQYEHRGEAYMTQDPDEHVNAQIALLRKEFDHWSAVASDAAAKRQTCERKLVKWEAMAAAMAEA